MQDESLQEQKNINLLDGGLATQLELYIDKPIDGDVLWSARCLATNPQAIIQMHLDFLRAGSDIITTVTYQATVEGFMKHLNLTKEKSYELIKSAVYLAKSACSRFSEEHPHSGKLNTKIAGSVGAYGAFLHDGSEYNGSYSKTTSPEFIKNWHRPRIEALVEAGVDILAMETIPCKMEAEVLVNLIKNYPQVKAWLTFSCSQDGKSLANGENFQAVARHCYDLNPEQLLAVGVNCIAPRLVESLFTGINENREGKPIPLIVYPNSGETYSGDRWTDKDKCQPIDSYVKKWLNLGVVYIGGCCRTNVKDICRIKKEVINWQHENKYNKGNN